MVDGELAVPLVHLNGTGRESLQKQYMEAYLAVGKALDAVAQNGPHGRDYYIKDGDYVKAAMEQHSSRLDRLHGVREELETILHSLQS